MLPSFGATRNACEDPEPGRAGRRRCGIAAAPHATRPHRHRAALISLPDDEHRDVRQSVHHGSHPGELERVLRKDLGAGGRKPTGRNVPIGASGRDQSQISDAARPGWPAGTVRTEIKSAPYSAGVWSPLPSHAIDPLGGSDRRRAKAGDVKGPVADRCPTSLRICGRTSVPSSSMALRRAAYGVPPGASRPRRRSERGRGGRFRDVGSRLRAARAWTSMRS
jgi:hypothetical protein